MVNGVQMPIYAESFFGCKTSQQICISWKRLLIRPLWPFGPILDPAKQLYDGIWFLLKIIVCNSYILCVPLYIVLVILYGSEIN